MRLHQAHVLGALLVISNALWAYSSYNAALDLDFQERDLIHARRALVVLEAILTESPRSVGPEGLAEWARVTHPEWVLKVDRSVIELEGLRLQFSGDTMVAIDGL